MLDLGLQARLRDQLGDAENDAGAQDDTANYAATRDPPEAGSMVSVRRNVTGKEGSPEAVLYGDVIGDTVKSETTIWNRDCSSKMPQWVPSAPKDPSNKKAIFAVSSSVSQMRLIENTYNFVEIPGGNTVSIMTKPQMAQSTMARNRFITPGSQIGASS
jgi:hypothetical protein